MNTGWRWNPEKDTAPDSLLSRPHHCLLIPLFKSGRTHAALCFKQFTEIILIVKA